MKIEVFFTPGQVDEDSLRERNVVVVDILRASTTIITALSNGAKEVVPTATVEGAVKIATALHAGSTLLCGEREGIRIDGFDLGNSPNEYTSDKVEGKTLVFSSTNGSVALTKGKYACALIVGGFVNLSEVVNFLKISEVDISIICAGKLNAFCLEDALCAGMMTSKLVGKKIRTFDLSDSAFAVVELHKSLGTNLLKSLQDSEHGRYLTEIGFGEDLKVCSQIDSIPVLPLMEDNVVRLRK
jgi:2-phosphosulfolactate phosphatase